MHDVKPVHAIYPVYAVLIIAVNTAHFFISCVCCPNVIDDGNRRQLPHPIELYIYQFVAHRESKNS